MQFMILRKADKNTEAGILPEEALFAAMGQYNEALVKAGVMRAGEGLHPSSKGARIKFSAGKPTVTDGPFTETKELIAGFTMIEVASMEEAIEWVKRWPSLDADGGVAIEIREGGCPGGLRGVSPSESAESPAPGLMRFMVMLKANEKLEAGVSPGEKHLATMARHNEEGVKAGVITLAEGLKPSAKGTRVKFSGGKPTVIDGPFTEAKELLAGFWMIQVKSRQEAINWALHYPYAFGAEAEIEVRQVYQASDFGEAFTPELRQAEERMRVHILESGKPLGAGV